MSISRDMVVIAVHGEGDRATVNRQQQHRNELRAAAMRRGGQPVPEPLTAPDEPPHVTIILADPLHPDRRIEWPVTSWDEVEEWKGLAGWDPDRRHWQTGALVPVVIGG